MAIDPTLAKILVTVGPVVVKKIYEHISQDDIDHGSKVKWGDLNGCSIGRFDGKVCILVNDDSIVYLTPDTISSCTRTDKKFKPTRGKWYYYLDVAFKNGMKSKIRVSKGKKEDMEKCGVVIHKQFL